MQGGRRWPLPVPANLWFLFLCSVLAPVTWPHKCGGNSIYTLPGSEKQVVNSIDITGDSGRETWHEAVQMAGDELLVQLPFREQTILFDQEPEDIPCLQPDP